MTRVLWLVMFVSVVQCSPMSQDELEDFSNFLLKTSSLDLHVKKGADFDDSFDEDEEASDHAWEESGKFEGDLILNDRQRRLIVENVEGLSRNGLTDSTKKWPDNEVIYFIQREHFNSGQVQAIQDGIDDLARASCVKFRPYRKGDRDAVVIQGSRRGCFSQVGYQGGYQVLNLSGRHPVGRGCFRHGTVVHELLHSLGFYHMQSSPDRDDYIDVKWANIVQPARHNFRKYNSFSVSDFGVGYDYDSVLHYSRRAFSANGQDTLVPKKLGAEIGQRVGLSDKDTQKLNKMYCDADNDHVQADENATQKPKNKKKKPKNQPFEGHGIGYHQGKTVVIKLPAAENYKLQKANVPSTHVFDFSKTPQIVSTPEAEGYRFGKEVTYQFKPTISLHSDTIMRYENNSGAEPVLDKKDDKLELLEKDKARHSSHPKINSNEVKPEYIPIDEHDKDIKEAFHRLTTIVKQHVYPQKHDYDHKINKDYGIFYSPLQLKKSNKHPNPGQQTDAKKEIQVVHNNSNDQYSNKEFIDRMDNFYRTSLPMKKPYSSYEQTETPRYATLTYLRGRDDYSQLYSPITPESKKHRDDYSSDENDRIYNQHNIKINPYGKSFYTDNVQNESISRPTDISSKDGKLSKYELAKSQNDEKSHLTEKQLSDKMYSSHKIWLPTKKPYSSYEQTETPTYATLEYLKDRHDISSVYRPKELNVDKQNEPYTVLGGELPPTETNWYKKKYFTHSPIYNDSDSHSYADDMHKYPKEPRRTHEEPKDRITDESNYDNGHYNEKRTTSSQKTQAKPKSVDDEQDFTTDYEKEENNDHITDDFKYDDDENEEKEVNYHGEAYDHDHYGKEKKDSARSSETPRYEYDDDDEDSNKSHKKNESKIAAVKEYHNFHIDSEEENSDSLSRVSNDNMNNGEPNKRPAYTQKGTPGSITKSWYKPSYSLPVSHEDEYLGSRENDYR